MLAWWKDQLAGCGAYRQFNATTCELKRMYVRPFVRGKGIGKQLYKHLYTAARQAGYKRMILETGLRQPEAIHLYRGLGFQQIPCFGEYEQDEFSICFEQAIE